MNVIMATPKRGMCLSFKYSMLPSPGRATIPPVLWPGQVWTGECYCSVNSNNNNGFCACECVCMYVAMYRMAG